jgi:YD repeat-containing protein
MLCPDLDAGFIAFVVAPTGAPGGSVTIEYTYDGLYRLVGANYSDGTYFRYSYDSVGNRLTEETVEGTTVYEYDDANRLASVDEVTYTWDANGILLDDGASEYTYDHANRLTLVDSPSSVDS